MIAKPQLLGKLPGSPFFACLVCLATTISFRHDPVWTSFPGQTLQSLPHASAHQKCASVEGPALGAACHHFPQYTQLLFLAAIVSPLTPTQLPSLPSGSGQLQCT